MTVNRKLWQEPLSKEYTPSWHCPSCSGGYLKMVPESLKYIQTSKSKKEQNTENPQWDPGCITYRFSALLECQNNDCEEVVSLAGHGALELVQIGQSEDFDYIEFFYPEFVSPSPEFFRIPSNCPNEIRCEIVQAFIAVWSDYASSATRVRVSIERLLDYLKEPKTKINKNGKRERLSLHRRIERFGVKDKEISDTLLAVKWLGNTGSHTTAIDQEDIFDAFDMLEYVLEEVLVKRRKNLGKLAKNINTKKGPVNK